jgi:hypothetical protein
MTAELWANIVAGVIMPFIVSTLKGASWSDTTKVVLSMVVSLILGAITAYIGGGMEWTIGSVLANATAIFTEATLIYKIWFQGSAVNEKLTEIGAK